MRAFLVLFLVSLLFLIGSCHDPMEHARCDDSAVKRIPSPDGKMVIVIYNRSCSGGTGLYTYAEVKDPSVWFSSPRHPEVCFLVTLAGGYHQLDATWKNDRNIEVSSTEELDYQYSISSQHEKCNDIDVTYKFKFKPPPVQAAPDEKTATAISEAISESQSCVGDINYLRKLVSEKQHRAALELLCSNVWVGKCPISKETFAKTSQAATTMGIDQSYLENLKPLVQN